MKKFENLLILIINGRPTKKRLDEKIDEYVNDIINDLCDGDDSKLFTMLYHQDVGLYQKSDFTIMAHPQYYNEIVLDLEKSVARYSPFFKLITYPNIDISKQTFFDITLILEITPKMKESMILEKDLSKNLTININTSQNLVKI